MRKLSISTSVSLGSGRIHHQLSEECKGKGKSLLFGSWRGEGMCFAFLGMPGVDWYVVVFPPFCPCIGII